VVSFGGACVSPQHVQDFLACAGRQNRLSSESGMERSPFHSFNWNSCLSIFSRGSRPAAVSHAVPSLRRGGSQKPPEDQRRTKRDGKTAPAKFKEKQSETGRQLRGRTQQMSDSKLQRFSLGTFAGASIVVREINSQKDCLRSSVPKKDVSWTCCTAKGNGAVIKWETSRSTSIPVCPAQSPTLQLRVSATSGEASSPPCCFSVRWKTVRRRSSFEAFSFFHRPKCDHFCQAFVSLR
jgi:hypothetical protein